MKTYRVTWTIDIDADTPREAAQMALDIQRDPDSCATCFEIDASPGLGFVDNNNFQIDLGVPA